MNDRITWTKCPGCGAPASVGWTATAWADGVPVEEVPVRLECSGGCPLSLEELRRSWTESDGVLRSAAARAPSDASPAGRSPHAAAAPPEG